MNIALIGSAPSSLGLAPVSDSSWEIWGCSPAAASQLRRADVWFELHPIGPGTTRWPKEYVEFMRSFKGPLYLIEAMDHFPTSVTYPKDRAIKEFGKYFFTSSVAWMFALAILKVPEKIGLWGIDMSADEEYGYQRAGCHFFMQEAERRGIEVVIPAESDIHRAAPLYGYCEDDPMWIKLQARKAELSGRLERLRAERQQKEKEDLYLSGAQDNLDYMLKTWI